MKPRIPKPARQEEIIARRMRQHGTPYRKTGAQTKPLGPVTYEQIREMLKARGTREEWEQRRVAQGELNQESVLLKRNQKTGSIYRRAKGPDTPTRKGVKGTSYEDVRKAIQTRKKK